MTAKSASEGALKHGFVGFQQGQFARLLRGTQALETRPQVPWRALLTRARQGYISGRLRFGDEFYRVAK